MHNSLMRRIARFAAILGLMAAGLPALSPAMQSLNDGEMSGVTGEGMAFVWTDFRMMFDPNSYIEQMGSPGSNGCSGTGQNAGNYNCLRRADLRWFGASVSATGLAVGQALGAGAWNTSWTTTGTEMTQCSSAGIGGLGCPRGGPIQYFAAPDNPYILRVNTYDGAGSAAGSIGNGVVTYQGNTGTGDWDPANAAAGSRQTVLEFLAPASATAAFHGVSQDNYRFSFWGEIESGRGAAGGGLLKSQTLIQGNAAGSAMRYFKFTQTKTSPGLAQAFNPVPGCSNADCTGTSSSDYKNGTLAIAYDSYLRGDFRFSVAQGLNVAGTGEGTGGVISDAIGTPVNFHPTEGMYFRGSDVHVPLGQLFYQALTINMPRNSSTNAPVQDGNFTLEIPVLPNILAVYTRFYSMTNYATGVASPNDWDDGYATARAAYLYNLPVRGGGAASYMPARTAATITNYSPVDANYHKTHGYARWGDWAPCTGVGCSVPTASNYSVNTAHPVNGVGRNAWNSSGDGVFFIGTTAFNAYAYSAIDVDTSTGNTYTGIAYYKGTTNKTVADVRTNGVYNVSTAVASSFTNTQNAESHTVGPFTSCNSTSATDFTTCGSGGSYVGAAQLGNKDTTATAATFVGAERSWLNPCSNATRATCFSANASSRPVIAVPAGTPLNLGDSRIEGLQMNFLRFTSYGALN